MLPDKDKICYFTVFSIPNALAGTIIPISFTTLKGVHT